MFNLNEFKSTITKNKEFQKTNLFTVEIPLCAAFQQFNNVGTEFSRTIARELHFYCTASNLPGIQIETQNIRRYGYGTMSESPNGVTTAGLNIIFYADGRGMVYNFLQQWLKYIVNFDSRYGMSQATGLSMTTGSLKGNQFPYEVNYKKDYAVDIVLNQFDPTGTISNSIVCTSAFPRFISDVSLDWGDQSSIQRIMTHWSFTDFYNPNLMVGSGKINFEQAKSTVDAINSLNAGKSSGNQLSIDSYDFIQKRFEDYLKNNI